MNLSDPVVARAVHQLIDAALDQPKPSPRLTRTLRRLLLAMHHPDRLLLRPDLRERMFRDYDDEL